MLAGVDIGGTFTDIVISDNGQLTVHKVLSTPDNPASAMLQGLNHVTGDEIKRLQRIVHGSTVATNAILERKGAKIAFLTTAGFRDLLFIGRQNRPDLYAIHPTIPAPIVSRDLCFDVPERLDPRGDVLIPLDMTALDRVLDHVANQNVDMVAVCLLYSFINPDHEEAIRDRILKRKILKDWQIALSCDVLPEFREYERASTVTLEAYVRPIMTRYVDQLTKKLPSNVPLTVMKSDGGVMQASGVRERAVQTALSGPAAGVIGAFHISQTAGYDHIITLDMGGTSTDVALMAGQPQHAATAQIDGLPLRARLLDIETIGAGGGSIARLDAAGALKVGPQSAGADPGPIAYGRGGDQITVSDANVMLGRLDPEHFLGGSMTLDIKATSAAFRQLAKSAKLDLLKTARGVIDVANANIDRALRRVSVARGHDPRQFTLVAFGGAGPLHACEVAQHLEISRVLIPRHPGVLCAYGLQVADIRLDYSRPILARATRNLLARLRALQAELLAISREDLLREGVDENAINYNMLLDMRYVGQAHELVIPFYGDVVEQFHEKHRETYGYDLPNHDVEIITMRLEALGIVEKPILSASPLGETDAKPARIITKAAPDGSQITLYDREKLTAGMTFEGQALVFQFDSTVYIPAGWQARVDGYHNLILESDESG